MTISQLMHKLGQYPGDVEVRLAIQPSYPFQHTISDVVSVDLDATSEDDDDKRVVYISEGGQLYSAPYLPSEACSELGW